MNLIALAVLGITVGVQYGPLQGIAAVAAVYCLMPYQR